MIGQGRYRFSGRALPLLLILMAVLALLIGPKAWANDVRHDDTGDVTLACADFAPFKMVSGRSARQGIDIEVLRAAFSVGGMTVSFQAVPWKRGLELARAGRVDGICGCSYAPEREQEFVFSDMLGEHHQGLFFLRDQPGPTTLADVKGRTIAVVRGYVLQKELEAHGAVVLEVVDELQLVRVTASGRADAAYAYRDVFRYHAGLAGEEDRFAYAPIRREPYYVCLSRAGERADLLRQRLNESLRTLRHDGTYERIWRSYGAGS